MSLTLYWPIKPPAHGKRYAIGFKGKNQLPLLMIWTEYWSNSEVVNGVCHYDSMNQLTNFKKLKSIWFNLTDPCLAMLRHQSDQLKIARLIKLYKKERRMNWALMKANSETIGMTVRAYHTVNSENKRLKAELQKLKDLNQCTKS